MEQIRSRSTYSRSTQERARARRLLRRLREKGCIFKMAIFLLLLLSQNHKDSHHHHTRRNYTTRKFSVAFLQQSKKKLCCLCLFYVFDLMSRAGAWNEKAHTRRRREEEIRRFRMMLYRKIFISLLSFPIHCPSERRKKRFLLFAELARVAFGCNRTRRGCEDSKTGTDNR